MEKITWSYRVKSEDVLRRVILDFKFRRVLNVLFFLLGNSSASELYMPTFRNTVCSIFIGLLRWNRLLCVLDRASSWYLNKGWPTRWHCLYYWVVVQPSLGYHITTSSGSACSRIPHHQQTIPLDNTSTPQVSLHNNATSSRKLLKMDVLTSETCWAVDN